MLFNDRVAVFTPERGKFVITLEPKNPCGSALSHACASASSACRLVKLARCLDGICIAFLVSGKSGWTRVRVSNVESDFAYHASEGRAAVLLDGHGSVGFYRAVSVGEHDAVFLKQLSRLHTTIKSLASENKKFDVMFVEAVGVFMNHVIEKRFAVGTQVTRRFCGSVRV